MTEQNEGLCFFVVEGSRLILLEEPEVENVQHVVESWSSSSLGKRERQPSKEASVKRLLVEEDDGGDVGEKEEEETKQRGKEGVFRESRVEGTSRSEQEDITEYSNLSQSDTKCRF